MSSVAANSERLVRLLFRVSSHTHATAKAFVNVRLEGHPWPTQLHVAYVQLRESLPPGQRAKLLRSLRVKWRARVAEDVVNIDWVDAERKLAKLAH
jgi:hypothetical protein